jgi:hypothetical protein
VFNHELTFRSWDKYTRVDFELERPECLATSDILYWFSALSSCNACGIEIMLEHSKRTPCFEIELRPTHGEEVSE